MNMNLSFKQIIHLRKVRHMQIYYTSYIISIRSLGNSYIIKNENKDISSEMPKVKPFSDDKDHIWVGPPHSVSNLRLKTFPTSKHLTEEEAHFYEKSKQVQDWNQEYWVSHNKDFEQSKKSYVERKTKEKNIDSDTSLNTEEMADFYREFLNKNYDKHLLYNWQWYKKNFELLYLSAKAKVSKLRKLVKKDVF